jgi:hypothetical protein
VVVVILVFEILKKNDIFWVVATELFGKNMKNHFFLLLFFKKYSINQLISTYKKSKKGVRFLFYLCE